MVNDQGPLDDDPGVGLTPPWTAPEVLREGAWSKKSDIFSLAMVMIEVCHRSTACRALTHYSYPCRYSQEQFHFISGVFLRSQSSYYKANAQNGQHIQPSQTICGV